MPGGRGGAREPTVGENDEKMLEAVAAELQELRALLQQPKVAEQLSSALLAKLSAKSSSRDRVQAAKVASVLLEVGEPLRAGSIFQALLELEPDEPYYRLGRAQAHLKAGEPQAAAMRFDEVLKHEPELVEAYVGRGEALLAQGRTSEALRDFERVVELDPQSTFAQLALVLLGQHPR